MKPPSPSTRLLARAVGMSLGIGLVSLLIGCDKPQEMVSGPGVPASQGTVKVSKTENGNTKIVMHVKHLALPFKVAPNAAVYVVWLKPKDGATINLGALVVNDNLKGTFETTTPHRHFQLSVTPEAGGHVDIPTHEAVFTADVERPD